MLFSIILNLFLFLLIFFILFVFFKLNNINKFNLSIYIILLMFWISSYLLKTSILKINTNNWKLPILLGSFQLIQVVFRFPFGKLSQKIKSRKIPIIISVLIMMFLSIPMIFQINYTNLLLSTIGFGVFASTFGMQNQYWGENRNIKEVFITTGLIGLLPIIGKIISTIIKLNIEINEQNYNYFIISFLIFSFLNIVFYLFQKEKKETILLDNMSEEGKNLSKLGSKNIIILSLMIFLASFSINFIFNDFIIKSKDFLIVFFIISIISIFTYILICFVLIKYINIQLFNNISQLLMIFGFFIILISKFILNNYLFSLFGFFISFFGYFVYFTILFGSVLHFDHKNHFLVLGIWLTFNSLSIGLSQIIGNEIYIFYPKSFIWALSFSISLSLISIFFSNIVYKKYNKKIFNTVKKIEKNNKSFIRKNK